MCTAESVERLLLRRRRSKGIHLRRLKSQRVSLQQRQPGVSFRIVLLNDTIEGAADHVWHVSNDVGASLPCK